MAGERECQSLTLCLIYRHPRVLLGLKKKGFGAGRWNGFGGKVEPGETIKQAAVREVKEEIGITVKNLQLAGELDFEFKDQKTGPFKIWVFRGSEFEGQPVESPEMKPRWFYLDEIPFKEMWPDDVYWLPLFFADRKFKGRFVFQDAKVLIGRQLEILS